MRWRISSRRGKHLLAAAGYAQYEVSAYSRPGFRCRHNLNYWSFGDYLGIGAGAHGKISFADGRIERYHKTRQPADYLGRAPAFSPPAAVRLDARTSSASSCSTRCDSTRVSPAQLFESPHRPGFRGDRAPIAEAAGAGTDGVRRPRHPGERPGPTLSGQRDRGVFSRLIAAVGPGA